MDAVEEEETLLLLLSLAEVVGTEDEDENEAGERPMMVLELLEDSRWFAVSEPRAMAVRTDAPNPTTEAGLSIVCRTSKAEMTMVMANRQLCQRQSQEESITNPIQAAG